MTIILPALAVAFAAFCVWLGVRIVNRRERWAKRLAVGLAIGLPVLYVASFGPVCWIVAPDRYYSIGPIQPLLTTPAGDPLMAYSLRTGPGFHQPLHFIVSRPGRVGDMLRWYICLGTDDDVIPMYFPDSIQWVVPTR